MNETPADPTFGSNPQGIGGRRRILSIECAEPVQAQFTHDMRGIEAKMNQMIHNRKRRLGQTNLDADLPPP